MHIESNGTIDFALPSDVWLTVSPKEASIHDGCPRERSEVDRRRRVPEEHLASFPISRPSCFSPKATNPATSRSHWNMQKRTRGVSVSRSDAQVHRRPVILLCCAVDAELGFWKDRDGIDLLAFGVGPVEAAAAVATAPASATIGSWPTPGSAACFPVPRRSATA